MCDCAITKVPAKKLGVLHVAKINFSGIVLNKKYPLEVGRLKVTYF